MVVEIICLYNYVISEEYMQIKIIIFQLEIVTTTTKKNRLHFISAHKLQQVHKQRLHFVSVCVEEV